MTICFLSAGEKGLAWNCGAPGRRCPVPNWSWISVRVTAPPSDAAAVSALFTITDMMRTIMRCFSFLALTGVLLLGGCGGDGGGGRHPAEHFYFFANDVPGDVRN